MSKLESNKKSRRGSPSSIRETSSPVTHPNQGSVLALKNLLAVPTTPAKMDKPAAATKPVDVFQALKAILAVPTTPVKMEESAARPKSEGLQALKSLLMSPVQGKEISEVPATPATFQDLKAMLMLPKKEEVIVAVPNKTKDKAKDKETPPRSEKKRKSKDKAASAANGKSAFAGSMFQNSPDPLAVPLPDFDEMQSSFFADDFVEAVTPTAATSPPNDQLNSLRMMLKIPA
jgi:hypothetical protein